MTIQKLAYFPFFWICKYVNALDNLKQSGKLYGMLKLGYVSLIFGILLVGGCSSYAPPSQEAMIVESSERLYVGSLGMKENPAAFALPESVADKTRLSAEDMVLIALWNNPELQEALSGLGVERGRIITAAHFANPRLTFMLPLGYRQFEFLAVHPILDTWLLRPQRIELATKNAAYYARTLEEQCLDVMLRVRLLCAQLNYNTAVRQNLLQEKQAAERLMEAQRLLVEHGRAGTVELMQLELEMSLLDASIQRETLNREEIKHNLNKVMGASERPWEWEFKADAVELPVVAQSREELIKLALVSRPSLRATEIQMESIAQKHNIAAREIWNFLVGVSDKEFGESKASGWTISLGIDLPVFNQNEGGKAVAKAELDKALRTYETQRNAIAHDIVAALQVLTNSQAQLERFERVVVPAAVRYQEQVKQFVEIGREGQQSLLLAEQQLEKVKAARAQCVYQYQCAYYQLERAIAGSLQSRSPH